MNRYFAILLFLFSINTYAEVNDVDTSDFRVAFDISGTRSGLTTYKGYSDDFSAYAKLKYKNWLAQPFARTTSNSYYYLDESIPGNNSFSRNERNAIGFGVDIFLNKYMRFRYLHDWINNKTSDSRYTQDSYLFVYNQYIDLEQIELNNYLESVIVPRYSNVVSTYLRIQALKTFYLARDIKYSHSFFPFAQLKLKNNDEEFFGKSGNLVSAGLGYKYYSIPNTQDSLTLLLEGHSVIHQSTNFHSDWFQILAVIQYLYK